MKDEQKLVVMGRREEGTPAEGTVWARTLSLKGDLKRDHLSGQALLSKMVLAPGQVVFEVRGWAGPRRYSEV